MIDFEALLGDLTSFHRINMNEVVREFLARPERVDTTPDPVRTGKRGGWQHVTLETNRVP
jgi:hypothetical protein